MGRPLGRTSACLAVASVLSLALTLLFSGGASAEDGITVEVLSEGGLVNGNWSLRANVTGDVECVNLTVDFGPKGPMEEAGDGSYVASIDTTLLEDGVHTANVVATGPNGTFGVGGVGIVVDNTAPSLNVTWLPLFNVTGEFPVRVLLTDEHLEGSNATLVVDPGPDQVEHHMPPTGSLGEHAVVLDSLDLGNGTRGFLVRAVDGAGNVAVTAPREFNFRNLPDLLFDWSQLRDEVALGRANVFRVQVRNAGNVPVDGFSLAFYFEGEEVDVLLHMDPLAPGDTVELVVNWTPTRSGRAQARLLLDHEGVIDELKESNNEAVKAVRVTTDGGGCFGEVMVLSVVLPAGAFTLFGRGGAARRVPRRGPRDRGL